MVLCYDCAECRQTISREDLFSGSYCNPFHTCKGGRTFKVTFMSNIFEVGDTSPNKFEDIDCTHFAPIRFDDERGRGSSRGGSNNKMKAPPPAAACSSSCSSCKPNNKAREERRGSSPDGCSICGSKRVVNVVVDTNKKTKRGQYNLCKRCSHVVNKYIVLNKVDIIRAIEVGKSRGIAVVDRNMPDDGSPVVVRRAGGNTFNMEDTSDVLPSECVICGKTMTPEIEKLPNGRAKLRYKCSNEECGASVEVDPGLL